MTPSLSCREVVRACKRRGWTIQPAALDELRYHADHHHDTLEALLDLLGSKWSLLLVSQKKTCITARMVQELLRDLSAEQDEQQHLLLRTSKRSSHGKSQRKDGSVFSAHDVKVMNAFQTPKLVYHPMRKQFQVDQERKSLFGTAEDKVRNSRDG